MKTIPAQVEPLLEVVHGVLGDVVAAAYLYGSAVMGGLRPDSDIDVLVVTDRPTTAAERKALISRLLEISMKPRPLELTAVVLRDVRPWRYPPTRDFQFGEWRRDDYEKGDFGAAAPRADPDLASLIRMVLLANEMLEGTPAKDVFEPVPRDDYVSSLVDGIGGLLEDLEWDTRNVVLTLARIWSSLATDEIRSKDDAATWALQRLPSGHRSALEDARALYLGEMDTPAPDFAAQARAFAAYVVTKVDDLSGAGLMPE